VAARNRQRFQRQCYTEAVQLATTRSTWTLRPSWPRVDDDDDDIIKRDGGEEYLQEIMTNETASKLSQDVRQEEQ